MAPLRHAVHILPDVLRAVFGSDDPDDLALLRAARVPAHHAGRRPRLVDAGARRRRGRPAGRPGVMDDSHSLPAARASVGRLHELVPRPRRRRARDAVVLRRVDDRRRAVASRLGAVIMQPPSARTPGPARATPDDFARRSGTSGTPRRRGPRPTTRWSPTRRLLEASRR